MVTKHDFDSHIEWLQELDEYIDKLLDDYKDKLEEVGKYLVENILHKIEKGTNKFVISFYICQKVGDYFTQFLLDDFIKLEEMKLKEVLGDDYEKIKEMEEEEEEKDKIH